REQCGPVPLRPLPKIEACKSWQLTPWREPQNQSQQMPKSRRMAEKVCDSRCQRCPSRPSVDHPKEICPQRPLLVFVIVRKEFGFVSRNVNVRGAFRFASFARKAQIERLLD